MSPKTVAKRRKRATVEDLMTWPKAPHSATLTQAEEAAVAAFRQHTLLPLNDCLYALQPRNRNTACSRQMRFDMICDANDIECRLTKALPSSVERPNHP